MGCQIVGPKGRCTKVKAFGQIPVVNVPACLYHYKHCYLWPSIVVQAVMAYDQRCARCGAEGAHLAPFSFYGIFPKDPARPKFHTAIRQTSDPARLTKALEWTELVCYACTKRDVPHVRFSDRWPFPEHFEAARMSILWVPGINWMDRAGEVYKKADGTSILI